MSKNEMQLRREDIEIMAPVGSWESLVAAHQGGADAKVDGMVPRARHEELPHR